MTATHQRPAGLGVLIASTAIGLGACGGSSYPRVANLGKGSGNTGRSATARAGSSGTKLAKDNPTRLVEEWADCERTVHMSLPPGAPARRAPLAATGALNIGAPKVPRVSNANSQAAGGG